MKDLYYDQINSFGNCTAQSALQKVRTRMHLLMTLHSVIKPETC